MLGGSNLAKLKASPGPQLMTWLGLPGGTAPVSLYLFETDTAVGTDRIGSAHLAGTGLTAVSDADLGPCLEWTDNTTDAMAAADSSVHNFTGAFMGLWLGKIVTNVGAFRGFWGKFDTTGYRYNSLSSDALQMQVQGQTRNLNGLNTYQDGNPFCSIGGLDLTNTDIVNISDREAKAITNYSGGSPPSTSAIFKIGPSPSANSHGMRILLFALWSGSAACAQAFSQAGCQGVVSALTV